MRRNAFIIVTLMSLAASAASAHPGGHGPQRVASCKSASDCTKAEVGDAATKVVATAAESGTLEATWKGATPEKVEKKTPKAGPVVWEAIFKNGKATDKAKQTIFVYVSTDGLRFGANYKGIDFDSTK